MNTNEVTKESSELDVEDGLGDLIARLTGAQNTLIKFSEVSRTGRNRDIRAAKLFDIYASSVFTAIAIIEGLQTKVHESKSPKEKTLHPPSDYSEIDSTGPEC